MSSTITPMHVVMVDPGCLTPAYDTELCQALAGCGHQISLVTAPYRNDQKFQFPSTFETVPLFFSGVNLDRYPRLRRFVKGLGYAGYYSRFLGWLKGRKVDAVHFQWLLVPPIDYFFMRRIRHLLPDAAMVVTIHDVQPLFRTLGSGYLTKILELVDSVVVHGEGGKRDLLRLFPTLRAGKVNVIPHGPLHHGSPVPDGSDQAAARKALGLPEDDHVGLFFGEMKEYKGLDVLANALAGLGEQDRARLTMVFAGKVEDETCARHLEQLQRMPFRKRFDLSYIPTERVSQYFAAADFVVLPYKAITQSGVLFAALANATPVIVTDVGELATVVHRTEGGWIVPPEDSLALRNAIRLLVRSDRAAVVSIGKQARERLEAVYGWNQIATSTTQLYQTQVAKQEVPGELRIRQSSC